jgi:hypothetical protein
MQKVKRSDLGFAGRQCCLLADQEMQGKEAYKYRLVEGVRIEWPFSHTIYICIVRTSASNKVQDLPIIAWSEP